MQNLYEIPGNPVCNANLQPGFSAPMSYIYEVPQDAEIQSFGFADSDVDAGADLSFITINPSPYFSLDPPTNWLTAGCRNEESAL